MLEAALQAFVAQLERRFGSRLDLSPADLLCVAEDLVGLCRGLAFNQLDLPEAGPGQELLHNLAVSPRGGPSIYLVSDGPGVTSRPHEHKTWAVIVGIRGCEINTKFRRVAEDSRQVVAVDSVSVGAGQYLLLLPTEIHATAVVGERATFHLHLYGSALHALPPFQSRCFEAVTAPEPVATPQVIA
jgi:predicted metal-dependent enzyme (double-stranded beta helix superfamily)